MRRERVYRVAHRRRREARTNYRQRLRLLRSGKPRFVARKSLNNFVCQVIAYGSGGDKTLATAYSNDIKKMGWKGHCGNLPAAYLTGLLCGVRAKKNKVNEAVMDAGLHPSTGGSALYAALKGAVDAGMRIPYSEDALPPVERISGKHISEYRKDGSLTKNFEETKSRILSGKTATKNVSPKKS